MKKNRRQPSVKKLVRAMQRNSPRLCGGMAKCINNDTLLCGSAKCINNDGMPELEMGRWYFIQEFPNFRGHVVVLGMTGSSGSGLIPTVSRCTMVTMIGRVFASAASGQRY